MHMNLPGFHPRRLLTLMRAAIERCELSLHAHVVLTEAASGAYIVTPVLAAMAGAHHVYAMTRSTRYGTVAEITEQTMALATLAGVHERIDIRTQKTQDIVSQADIITNSGHVRPLDASLIAWMKPTAVVALMYEAWEFRPGDVDLVACRQRGIGVAAVNERHPAVDVFSFLGMMAIKLLTDAGLAVYTNRILLLCDNPFGPFIERALQQAGAQVETYATLSLAPVAPYDAILVALHPHAEPRLGATDAATIAARYPGAVVAQYWGDMDRQAFAQAGVPICPQEAPGAGHMAILPSAIGPEAIVRLQTGGLKAAADLAQSLSASRPCTSHFVEIL